MLKLMRFFLLTVFIFNLSFASTTILDKFEKKLQNYKSFKANIVEELQLKEFEDNEKYYGSIIINSNGEVLYRFTKPEKMFIYIDKRGYVYGYSYEDDEIYKQKLSSNEFYLKLFRRFLSKKSINDLFKSIKEEKRKNGYRLILLPKDKKIKKVYMDLDKNLNIKDVIVITKDGKAIYRFSNIKYSKHLEPVPYDVKKILKRIK
ncbi:MAG: hypothetical protein DSY66_05980 [Persephonella sp.]|nr:MAG: hypothetical protein DSY53_04265 [Persephonella sp.]RUM59580.1 MAG: hypothetical protein DSY66_05980 [Persephonella sp.]